MDMRIIDKSSRVTALLVDLHDSHKLYLSAKEDPHARSHMTNAVAGLLDPDIELNEREQSLLSEALITLIRQAETDLRQAVAERLSVMPQAPLPLVLHLANDEISVAAPVLERSPVLSDIDLLYIIKAQGPAYWQAIAARESLSDEIVDVLADKKDMPTALRLTRNDKARLTRHALDVFAVMATESEDLARPLLMRPELPENLARALYKHVGRELREYIQSYFGITDVAVLGAVDEVIVEFTDPAAESEFMPPESIMRAARQYAEGGKLTLQALLNSLKRGQLTSFIALFALYAGLPVKTVHDYLAQPSGKGLAVVCRALGIQKNECAMIYLLTSRMRSSSRADAQGNMNQVMAYFDSVRPEAAMKMVKEQYIEGDD